MMRVPEGLITLLPDLCMSGRKNEQHAQKHDMPSNATGLHVMNLHRSLRAHQ